ncbi:hypothetical protein CALVIDRAFT_569465 [Calocera viscosa TUFC12733]|uniref:Uncharacterized protein n=1 Tax=Calocera viscosa (strain TUFC12733) TaxID=1330018 RepID=A0A167FXL4_CALVF|nr:hypothetical protein CALVIDRAFT_569465 [Calocera viscosa TUFC12733]
MSTYARDASLIGDHEQSPRRLGRAQQAGNLEPVFAPHPAGARAHAPLPPLRPRARPGRPPLPSPVPAIRRLRHDVFLHLADPPRKRSPSSSSASATLAAISMRVPSAFKSPGVIPPTRSVRFDLLPTQGTGSDWAYQTNMDTEVVTPAVAGGEASMSSSASTSTSQSTSTSTISSSSSTRTSRSADQPARAVSPSTHSSMSDSVSLSVSATTVSDFMAVMVHDAGGRAGVEHGYDDQHEYAPDQLGWRYHIRHVQLWFQLAHPQLDAHVKHRHEHEPASEFTCEQLIFLHVFPLHKLLRELRLHDLLLQHGQLLHRQHHRAPPPPPHRHHELLPPALLHHLAQQHLKGTSATTSAPVATTPAGDGDDGEWVEEWEWVEDDAAR